MYWHISLLLADNNIEDEGIKRISETIRKVKTIEILMLGNERH